MSDLFDCMKWQFLKLKEICVINRGVFTSTYPGTSSEANFPYIKAKDISFNTITDSYQKVLKSIPGQNEIKIVPEQSILIAVSGANAGNIALLGRDAVVNHDVFYATIQNRLLQPKFLYYYLFFNRNMLVKVSKYALRVSYRYLQKLNVPLPSISEQKQIIEFLDTHLSLINTSADQIKKVIDEINYDKQLLLNKIFSGNTAGTLFTEAKTMTLKECGVIQAGRTPNGSIRDYYGTDHPLFKPYDLKQEMQLKSSDTYLSAKGLKEARYVRANSLLICSGGAHFGKVGITKVDGACSQQMISFTPDSTLIPEFIYFQMNSERFQQQLMKRSKNLMLKKTDFQSLILAVTSLDSQLRIVNRICHEINLLKNKEENLQKKLLSLEKEKKNLLLRSFNSKFS